MSNHFNELLLQTLKDVGIRLERLEGRVDHVINEKADKTDVQDVKSAIEKLDQKADKTDVQDVKADVKDVRSDLKSVSEKLDQKADKEDLKSVNEKLDQKADKSDVKDVKSDVKDVKSDVNALRDEVRSHGQRLDRIETGIKTLQWTMTAGLAVLGIILAFMRSC